MSKLIKHSTKRDAWFTKLKEELQPELPGMRVLCPTRWTARADSLKSVRYNYIVLHELLEEVEKTTQHSDIITRVIGVVSQILHGKRFDGLNFCRVSNF